MKLSTPVNIPQSSIKICHKNPVTLIGSCFASSIGHQLDYHKFNCCINPFGIIYNPISLAKSLNRIIQKDLYQASELLHFDEKWISLDHHGSFSDIDKEKCLEQINQQLSQGHEFLKKSTTLIITFGSAWVYEYKDFGVVANCHKIPSTSFKKRLLSVTETIAQYESVLQNLTAFNPSLNLIFTISPVRHIKDGLHQNNLSKSILQLATHHLVNQHENCHYFPAYEIVVDELRDYRFFKEDMVHPSHQAVQYIWEKFGACYFDETTLKLNAAIGNVQRALAHRPIDDNTAAHAKFLAKTQDKINALKERHPYLNF